MTTTKTTAPAATDDTATRVGPMHEAFAAWLAGTHGVSITPEQVFAVTARRKAFRSSDAYRVGVRQAREQAKAAEAEAKAQRAAAREAERVKKAQEKATAAAEKPAPNAPAKATKAPAAKPATKKAAAPKATSVKTA